MENSTVLTVSLLKVSHFVINSRERSTTILTFGKTEIRITLPEGRLDLTSKRPSCQATGTHLFPRSVSVWRPAIRSSSLSSTGKPTLFSLWSLMGSTAQPHWAVTRGRDYLVHRLPCSQGVTLKGLMLPVLWVAPLKQGSVSLATTKMTAFPVIPESVLVPGGDKTTRTHVETKQ